MAAKRQLADGLHTIVGLAFPRKRQRLAPSRLFQAATMSGNEREKHVLCRSTLLAEAQPVYLVGKLLRHFTHLRHPPKAQASVANRECQMGMHHILAFSDGMQLAVERLHPASKQIV